MDLLEKDLLEDKAEAGGMLKRFVRNFVIVAVSVVIIGTLVGQFLRHFTEGAEYPVRNYVEVAGQELPEGLPLVAEIRDSLDLDPDYAAAVLAYYEAHLDELERPSGAAFDKAFEASPYNIYTMNREELDQVELYCLQNDVERDALQLNLKAYFQRRMTVLNALPGTLDTSDDAAVLRYLREALNP